MLRVASHGIGLILENFDPEYSRGLVGDQSNCGRHCKQNNQWNNGGNGDRNGKRRKRHNKTRGVTKTRICDQFKNGRGRKIYWEGEKWMLALALPNSRPLGKFGKGSCCPLAANNKFLPNDLSFVHKWAKTVMDSVSWTDGAVHVGSVAATKMIDLEELRTLSGSKLILRDRDQQRPAALSNKETPCWDNVILQSVIQRTKNVTAPNRKKGA